MLVIGRAFETGAQPQADRPGGRGVERGLGPVLARVVEPVARSAAGPVVAPAVSPVDGPDAAPDALRLAAIHALVAALPDPEIPVVTLEDLGILRGVVSDPEEGLPVVLLTPTYSGCPATEAIASEVRSTLDEAGFRDARVRIVLSPAWSSDWISPAGRDKLRAWGIAPPACLSCQSGAAAAMPACPGCSSAEVELLSRWGSTPCKAMYRCLACREPFDYFKPY